MSYSAARQTAVKVDVSPSLLYNNLACAPHKTVRAAWKNVYGQR
jgi:hypothetical protein